MANRFTVNTAILITAAAALGFGLGRLTSPSPVGIKDEAHGAKKVTTNTTRGSGGGEFASTASAPPPGEGFSLRMAEGPSIEDRFTASLANNDSRAREREMEEILAGLDATKIKGALEWAMALPEGPAKHSLMKQLMERWGQLDGPGAAVYGAELLVTTGNLQPLRDALIGWGRTDAGAAISYAQSLDLGNGVRRDITRDVLEQWADRDPRAAAAFMTNSDTEVGRGGTARLIADRWSQQNPRAALEWAMSLADADDQRRALEASIRNWADVDLQTAAAFAKQQPEGPAKEAMIGGVARSIARLDPAAGMEWAASITDTGLQTRAALGVIWQSAGRDSATAIQLLQNAPLDPQVQQNLVGMISSGHFGTWGPTPQPRTP